MQQNWTNNQVTALRSMLSGANSFTCYSWENNCVIPQISFICCIAVSHPLSPPLSLSLTLSFLASVPRGVLFPNRQRSLAVTLVRLSRAERGSLALQTEVKRPIKMLLLPENSLSVPDSVLFGHPAPGDGGNVPKDSLVPSHCDKKTFHHLPSRDIVSYKWSLFRLLATLKVARLSSKKKRKKTRLSLISSRCLSSFFQAWHPAGVDKQLQFEGKWPSERGSKPHRQSTSPEHRAARETRTPCFCGERICKIIQPDGLMNATLPCSQRTLGTF